MKKNILSVAVVLFFLSARSFAQDNISGTYRIALFAPVYLDSVLGNNIPNADKSIPKFVMPGLEFIQGARIALDTLLLNGKHAEAHIYDTKSNNQVNAIQPPVFY